MPPIRIGMVGLGIMGRRYYRVDDIIWVQLAIKTIDHMLSGPVSLR
jgi:hypothetical protein